MRDLYSGFEFYMHLSMTFDDDCCMLSW